MAIGKVALLECINQGWVVLGFIPAFSSKATQVYFFDVVSALLYLG